MSPLLGRSRWREYLLLREPRVVGLVERWLDHGAESPRRVESSQKPCAKIMTLV